MWYAVGQGCPLQAAKPRMFVFVPPPPDVQKKKEMKRKKRKRRREKQKQPKKCVKKNQASQLCVHVCVRVCVHAMRVLCFPPFLDSPLSYVNVLLRLRVRVHVRVRLLLFLRRCCVTIFPSYFPVYISFKKWVVVVMSVCVSVRGGNV